MVAVTMPCNSPALLAQHSPSLSMAAKGKGEGNEIWATLR